MSGFRVAGTWRQLAMIILIGALTLTTSACDRQSMSRENELALQEELFRLALRGADTTRVCFLACREGEGDTSTMMQDPPPGMLARLADLELDLLSYSAALPHPDPNSARLGLLVGPDMKPGRTYVAWIRKRLTPRRVIAEFGVSENALSGRGFEVLMERRSGRWKIVKELSNSVS
jgi:hypothetical protein